MDFLINVAIKLHFMPEQGGFGVLSLATKTFLTKILRNAGVVRRLLGFHTSFCLVYRHFVIFLG